MTYGLIRALLEYIRVVELTRPHQVERIVPATKAHHPKNP